MSIKVFILGRPGSGKSTAAHHMIKQAKKRNYSTLFRQDYDFLYKMFLEDSEQQRFRPAERGGFDVIDYSVLDTALQQLEIDVSAVLATQPIDITVIEFARSDYGIALKVFSPAFLHNAYFFFIDSDLERCIQRVQERVTHLPLPDHHFVSEYVMRTYYNNDNWEYMTQECKQEHALYQDIIAVHNDGPLAVLLDNVNNFTEMVFQHELMGLLSLNKSGRHLFQLHEVDHM